MWNVESFMLLWSAWSYVECEEFYTVMACPVSCGMWEVLYCYGLPGFMWNVESVILLWPAWFHVEWERLHPVSLWSWDSCGLLFSGTGRVVVYYSLKLGEFSSFIKC